MQGADRTARLGDRMVRGGAVTLVGSVVSRLASAAAVVVLARHLDTAEFAVFAFGTAYAVFFSTVADLGLDTVTIRELAARPDERGETLGSAFVAKGSALVVAAVAAAGVALLYGGELRTAGLVGTVAVLQALPGTYGLVLTADVQLTTPTVIRTVALVGSAAAAVAVALGGGGPILVLAVQAGLGFAPGFVLLAIARRRAPMALQVSLRRVRSLLRESVPVALATVAVVVFARVDQLILGALGTEDDLAAYGAIVRVVDVLNFVPIAVITVALPAVATLADTDPGRVRLLTLRGNRYLASVALPVAAVATVVGGRVLELLFGAPYADDGDVLAVLLWAHAFAFAFLMSRQILVGLQRSSELARLAWIAAAINVVLNLALIPSHGALGAAVASLVAYSSPMLVVAVRGRTSHPFALAGRAMVRPAAAAGALLGVLMAVDAIAPLPVVLAAAVCAAPAALAATGSLRLRDVRELTDALRSGARG